MGYLKQDEVKRSKSKKGTAKKGEAAKKLEPVQVVVTGADVPPGTPNPPLQHDINYVAGLIDIRDSLDWIAKGLMRLTSDEHNIHLAPDYGTAPLKLTLADNDEEEAMARASLPPLKGWRMRWRGWPVCRAHALSRGTNKRSTNRDTRASPVMVAHLARSRGRNE